MTSGLDDGTARTLRRVAEQYGTPCFVYFAEPMRQRLRTLARVMDGRFTISYAMKCNPNIGVLRALGTDVSLLDASSAGELARGVAAGYAAAHIAFSGPCKRRRDVEYAVDVGCGAIVCESIGQLALVDAVAKARGRRQAVLLRINPLRVPRRFGLQMGGRASQFGIDEEAIDGVLAGLPTLTGVDCQGLHVYSAGNSLDEDAIAENIEMMAEMFGNLIARHGLSPRQLVFGSGFGIPYFAGDRDLDLSRLSSRLVPAVDRLRARPGAGDSRCVLEMGRWIVGPDGYLLTSVVDAKNSRGTEIRICDAGFNNHLSACGMLGTVMRRNWPFHNLSSDHAEPVGEYLLAGPLCASFDVLGTAVELPMTDPGDVLAIGASGAYGLTASPSRFISHPEPHEVLVDGDPRELFDVTESRLNAPPSADVVRRTDAGA